MAAKATLLTIEFLKWAASPERTYAERREGWRSTCPLTCAWEGRDVLERARAAPSP